MKKNNSVFEDRITLAFVLHVRLDVVGDLKESLEESIQSVDGVDLIFQKKSEDKLYITPEKPKPEYLGGDGCVKER